MSRLETEDDAIVALGEDMLATCDQLEEIADKCQGAPLADKLRRLARQGKTAAHEHLATLGYTHLLPELMPQ